MQRSHSSQPLLLVATLLLAGCAGAGGSAEDDEASATGEAPDAGSVAGTVVDDAFTPLAGAAVGIPKLGPNVTATTDAEGGFFLPHVSPGSHTLVATKIGYVTTEVPLVVGYQETLTGVEIVMIPVPAPKESYYVALQPGQGFIACAFKVGALTLTTVHVCELDPNHEPFYDFEVYRDRGLVSVVLELAWSPSAPGTASHLRQELWKNPNCVQGACVPDVRYGMNSGPSPLKMVFGNMTGPFADGLELEGPTTLTQFAHVSRDEEPIVVVVVQQPVTHYVTAFYNLEPEPDYTALPPS